MCLARLLTKLSKEETFVEDDWNDVISLALTACQWLVENSRIEITQETSQVHVQPKASKKRNKTKE
jgi:hypothetical protein